MVIQATQGRHPPGFGPGNGQEGLSGFGGMQKWDLPPPPPPPPPLPATMEDQNAHAGGFPSGLWNRPSLLGHKEEEHLTHVDTQAELPSTSRVGFSNSDFQSQRTMGSMPDTIGSPVWPVSLPSESILKGQTQHSMQEQASQDMLGTGAVENAWMSGTIDSPQKLLSLQEQLSSSGQDWITNDAAWQHCKLINPGTSSPAVSSSHLQTGGQGYPGSISLQGIASSGVPDRQKATFHLDAPGTSEANVVNAWRTGRSNADTEDKMYMADTRDGGGSIPEVSQPGSVQPDAIGTGILRIQEDPGTVSSNFRQGEDWASCLPNMASSRNPGREGGMSCSESCSQNPVPHGICTSKIRTPEMSILLGMNQSDSTTFGTTSRQWWRVPNEGFLQHPVQRVKNDQYMPWIPPEYPGMPKLDLGSMSKDELLEILPCPRIVFGGVFLLKESRDRLLQIAAPKHSNVYCDHMTVVYKPGAKGLLKLPIGKFVTLTIAGEAYNDSCQVVHVTPPSSVAPAGHAPHITISLAEGAQPKLAVELASDVHAGKKELSQKWQKPLQLLGVVGVRLDNRSTVLSLEEFFVRTGVNLRHVRRRLEEVLRPNGVKPTPLIQGDQNKKFQAQKGQDTKFAQAAPTQSTEIPQSIKGTDMKTVEKSQKPADVPSDEEIRMLVEQLTDQFAGLDKHVARQLLVVSDWNLTSAQNYLRGDNGAETNAPQVADTSKQYQEKNSPDSKTVGHLKGPGILHVPYDVLEKSTVQHKPSGSPQPVSQNQRIVLDDSSPTKRKMKQDELR